MISNQSFINNFAGSGEGGADPNAAIKAEALTEFAVLVGDADGKIANSSITHNTTDFAVPRILRVGSSAGNGGQTNSRATDKPQFRAEYGALHSATWLCNSTGQSIYTTSGQYHEYRSAAGPGRSVIMNLAAISTEIGVYAPGSVGSAKQSFYSGGALSGFVGTNAVSGNPMYFRSQSSLYIQTTGSGIGHLGSTTANLLKWQYDGGVRKYHFNGDTPAALPVVTTGSSADDIITALQGLGIFLDS